MVPMAAIGAWRVFRAAALCFADGLAGSKAGVGVAGYVQQILILFAGHPHTVFAGSGGGLR
jgi:hypothetical protein